MESEVRFPPTVTMDSLAISVPDPNQIKNRIPTTKEEAILRLSTKKEEQKLNELDTEISNLLAEAEGYQKKVQEMVSALQEANTLRITAEKAHSALSELSNRLSMKDPANSTVSSPAQRMKEIEKSFSDTHAAYLKSAQSTLEKAREEYRHAEEEIDVNSSLFHYTHSSLTSRIGLRAQLDSNLRRMKDLLGPRRRIPNEVWSLIFWERIAEDEEEYDEGWRKGSTPYTTLKLTWVCQLWRQIIIDQPSLWCFIALPQDLYITSMQADRLRYFKERLKGHSPSVYMVYGAKGAKEGGLHLQDLLKELPRVKYFEVQITSDPTSLERFLDNAQVATQDLYLVASPRNMESETDLKISRNALKNVKSLACHGVRPTCSADPSEGEYIGPDSLYMRLQDIRPEDLVPFLEASGVATFTIECYDDLGFYEVDEVGQDLLLTHLTMVTAPVQALKFIFHQQALLPNLHTLNVDHDSTCNIADTMEFWASFLSIHERRDTITTLKISGLPYVVTPDEASDEMPDEVPDMFSDFINQLPKLERLDLEAESVVLSLKGLVKSKKIPSNLVTIRILGSDDVTEETITAFLKVFYMKTCDAVSLEIQECRLITKDVEERLELAHEALKKTKAKKKRK